MKTVAVAGGFDPIHRGHIYHLQEAAKLGDYLIVITHENDIIRNKKGYCLLPLEDRLAVLKELSCVDEVIVSEDSDGTVCKTLIRLHPDIFAKGGNSWDDRSLPEKNICDHFGIRIVYGVGGYEKIQSSSTIVDRVIEELVSQRK